MAYNVTSSFISLSRSKTPTVVRKFTLAGSDYSARVSRWPKFSRAWDEIRPKTLQLRLANADDAMGFLRDDKTKMEGSAVISMGFGNSVELSTNGSFLTDTDWTKGSGWTISGGAAVATASPTANRIGQAITSIELGKVLSLSFKVSNYSSGGVRIIVRTADLGATETVGPTENSNGIFTYILPTTQINAWIELQVQGTTTLDVDYFNCQEAETIELFHGTVKGVAYKSEICTLSIVDKWKQLSERLIGDDETPVSYTGSNYLPSDLFWWAVTSYGGLDTNSLAANVDIDVDAFDTWANVFSGDSVFMEAEFTGQKVTEVLRKIARQTRSAIFIKEDKISVHRFSPADVNVTSIGPDQIHDLTLSFNTGDIVNRQSVAGDLTVGSTHQFVITEVDAASVNSFGPKENILKDDNLWYADSASAINLAQRMLIVNANPEDKIEVTAGLVGLPRLIGETITVIDVFHSISENYRIMEHSIDMDKGVTKFDVDRTQIIGTFILDTSSLGSATDLLS